MKYCLSRYTQPYTSYKNNVSQLGLSYVEVIIATLVLAVALVPAINALFPAIAGSTVYQSDTENHYHLAAKLEEVLAQPYDNLDQEAINLGDEDTASNLYSDALGSSSRRLVFLSRYQPADLIAVDPSFTTSDMDLLWVGVQLEGSGLAMATLVSRYEY